MDIFIRPFITNQFMMNALVAGIPVSVYCGIVGTFMVLRGLAFIGDALSHCAAALCTIKTGAISARPSKEEVLALTRS